MSDNKSIVHVNSYMRDGHEVSAHTRGAPGIGNLLGLLLESIAAADSENNYDDSLAIKNSLMELGYYTPPKWGLTGHSEGAMFDGIKKFQKDNGLTIDGIIKPRGETEKAINMKLKKAASLSAAGMRGLSLGWSDEAHGAMGGLGYGIGSLNSNWNKTGESFSEAFKRGYTQKRDEHRQIVKDGYEQMPTAMATIEAAGAVSSPANKLIKSSSTTPLRLKSKVDGKKSLLMGTAYGIGTGEDGIKEHARNAVVGAVSGYGGYKASKFINRNMTIGATGIGKDLLNSSLEHIGNNIIEKNLLKQSRNAKNK